MKNDKIQDELKKAYDQTVDDFVAGIDPLDKLPKEFRESREVKEFFAQGGGESNQQQDKDFLNPKAGMKFLDVGSCANLFNYRLDKWPSVYYGIDISEKLIASMKRFVERKNIKIGGLYVADVAKMPFNDNFFDIAAVIGVIEYFDIDFIKKALAELHRVIKPGGRMVVDMPNLNHHLCGTMIKIEQYQGRPHTEEIPTQDEIVSVLEPLFEVERIDDSGPMTKYYVACK